MILEQQKLVLSAVTLIKFKFLADLLKLSDSQAIKEIDFYIIFKTFYTQENRCLNVSGGGLFVNQGLYLICWQAGQKYFCCSHLFL